MVRDANVKQAAAEKQLKEAQGKVCDVVKSDFVTFSSWICLPVDLLPLIAVMRLCGSQIDVLQAEVTALKTLVLTSTPSSPNRQMHPQLLSPGTRGAHKKGGHVRNKSASGAFASSPGNPESLSAPVQPAAKAEREVT